jgi:hypothetical protein
MLQKRGKEGLEVMLTTEEEEDLEETSHAGIVS